MFPQDHADLFPGLAVQPFAAQDGDLAGLLLDQAQRRVDRRAFQIMSGELKAGEPLPSIRSLAKSLQISVLTVQKAYDDACEKDSLISSISPAI
mgnify:CR=1 FL=1